MRSLIKRERQKIRKANDPALHALIDAASEGDRQQAIEDLVNGQVSPMIVKALNRSRTGLLHKEDFDDIAAIVALRVIRRFHRIPFALSDSIKNLDEFVARLSNNAVYDALRRRFPQRTRLRNKLRYALSTDRRFVTWLSRGITIAGLSDWGAEREALRDPDLPGDKIGDEMLDQANPADALHAVLMKLCRPVSVEDLIRIFSELWGVIDDPIDRPEAETPNTPLDEIETRQRLAKLWQEIRSLPVRQRIALLLNMRDSNTFSPIALFVLVGTATFDEIAEAVEMTSEQLFVIWNDLPIDDLTIADKLGITRQQVINLRKSARERLSRRLTMNRR